MQYRRPPLARRYHHTGVGRLSADSLTSMYYWFWCWMLDRLALDPVFLPHRQASERNPRAVSKGDSLYSVHPASLSCLNHVYLERIALAYGAVMTRPGHAQLGPAPDLRLDSHARDLQARDQFNPQRARPLDLMASYECVFCISSASSCAYSTFIQDPCLAASSSLDPCHSHVHPIPFSSTPHAHKESPRWSEGSRCGRFRNFQTPNSSAHSLWWLLRAVCLARFCQFVRHLMYMGLHAHCSSLPSACHSTEYYLYTRSSDGAPCVLQDGPTPAPKRLVRPIIHNSFFHLLHLIVVLLIVHMYLSLAQGLHGQDSPPCTITTGIGYYHNTQQLYLPELDMLCLVARDSCHRFSRNQAFIPRSLLHI